ncbi:hypothetical protein DFJ77DRAFT_470125 [Powellomyces hirtus]|nr:hypothetical protein DFJ77DRAFT_482002 [Powellomyces hirtus]KAI8910552.1 hypothetical protein DFJ77DRAFT_470125 [Powellomyces hirtus]
MGQCCSCFTTQSEEDAWDETSPLLYSGASTPQGSGGSQSDGDQQLVRPLFADTLPVPRHHLLPNPWGTLPYTPAPYAPQSPELRDRPVVLTFKMPSSLELAALSATSSPASSPASSLVSSPAYSPACSRRAFRMPQSLEPPAASLESPATSFESSATSLGSPASSLGTGSDADDDSEEDLEPPQDLLTERDDWDDSDEEPGEQQHSLNAWEEEEVLAGEAPTDRPPATSFQPPKAITRLTIAWADEREDWITIDKSKRSMAAPAADQAMYVAQRSSRNPPEPPHFWEGLSHGFW